MFTISPLLRRHIALTRLSSSAAPNTATTLLPYFFCISFLTWAYDLYISRRHFSPQPVAHHVLLFRHPGLPLSHPSTRVFNVRADRNILASGLLSHCFFEPELAEEDCRFLVKLPRRRMPEVLAWFMKVKRGCDKMQWLESPLEYGEEGTKAKGIERDWVDLCAAGLVGMQGERQFGGRHEEGYEEGEGWEEYFEVWKGVVRNRCEGWVVEPGHKFGSLEDDDEMPYTWDNSVWPKLKVFDGEWASSRPRERRVWSEVRSENDWFVVRP